MTILISGGAGFIGSNLVGELIKKGRNVLILDINKEPKNLFEILPNINYIQGDVRDIKLLKNIFRNTEINGVVHLAAVSRVIWGEKYPNKCLDININGTRNLLETIKISNQKPWFVFGSSREVYGESSKLPVSENYNKIPVNIYGTTKYIGENLVKFYSEKIGLKASILRFSNVYGNEKDILSRVLPNFILSALNGGEIEIHGGNQIIDFTHINDTVNGILKTIISLENYEDSFYVNDFHILTGKGTTLQEVVDIISRHLKKKLNIIIKKSRTYDVDKFIGNPKKANDFLKFKSKIFPKEGICSTIDCYKEVFNV